MTRQRKLTAIVTAVFLGWLGVDRFVLKDYPGGIALVVIYVALVAALQSNIDALMILQAALVLFGIIRGVMYAFSGDTNAAAKDVPEP